MQNDSAMTYDVLVIGAGLSGLTSASLLAKKGLKVGVVDKGHSPGGACGAFKRKDTLFDQGASLFFGFGTEGFNPHRFVFNALEEPLDIICHDPSFSLDFDGHHLEFSSDIESFVKELIHIFPDEREGFRQFYSDTQALYQDIIIDSASFTTLDEMDGRSLISHAIKHPDSSLKCLGFMNISTYRLLKKYFQDPNILELFNKLTSAYYHTTIRETPAILGALLFVDSHIGGTYYPAGSSLFLTGKLENVIEENGGDMYMQSEVMSLIFKNDQPRGVALRNGERLMAADIIYSGNVWDLYNTLLPAQQMTPQEETRIKKIVPTDRNAVLYLEVAKEVIPESALPLEIFTENHDDLRESEITVRLMSIDDSTLCGPDSHAIVAIGPCSEDFKVLSEKEYEQQKEELGERMLAVLEEKFPGISDSVKHLEVATPLTLERFAGKFEGGIAGPKHMMRQRLFQRQHTRTRWETLFCCGESTVMGSGTAMVTTSGIAAANAILRKNGYDGYTDQSELTDQIHEIRGGYNEAQKYRTYDEKEKKHVKMAEQCQFCIDPLCNERYPEFDVPGIMRRITVGNFAGAAKQARLGIDQFAEQDETRELTDDETLEPEHGQADALPRKKLTRKDFLSMQTDCSRSEWSDTQVPLARIMKWLLNY